MNKKYFILKNSWILLLLLISSFAFGQAAKDYCFTATSSTYNVLSGSATNFGGISATDDDNLSVDTILPFSFTFGGTAYTQIKVSSNGWLTFDMGVSNSYYINSSVNAVNAKPVLAPLWDDLRNTSRLRYETTGSSPNRIFKMEWSGQSWDYLASGSTISFQVWLYETTNVIEYYYNRESGLLNNASATIGIYDHNNTYLTLNGSGTSPTASSSTFTTSLSSKPASGQVYRFTPPKPAVPATISGTVTQCPSLIGQTYTVPTVINATNYSWAVPTGWTITAGATTNTITVTTGAVNQNGNITVTAGNSCGVSAPSTLAVSVSPASVGGSVSGGTTICSGTTSGLLTLSGNTGNVVRWESAVSPFTTWNPIVNTTTTYTSGALTQSTQFRALVQNGSCAIANSSSVLIQVYEAVGNNSVSYANGTSGQVNDTAAENASVVLTAPAGTYFSQVNFASYGTSTGTSPNFVINPSCHAANSQSVSETYLLGNTGSITIPATNTVFGDPCSGTVKKLSVLASYTQPICSGTSVAITGTTPTGGSGTFTYLWESSTTSATSGFASAAGTNNVINYTTGSLTQTTWFRRVVTSCSLSSNSAVVMVKVIPALPASVSISASPTGAICAGTSVTFTATPTNGGTTPSYQWKVNGTDAGTNSATFTTTTLANTDSVIVVMTSNATPCLTGLPATSNAIVMTVNSGEWTGALSTVWGDAGNWCGGVPTAITDVVISYGTPFQPVISADAFCNSLKVNANASLSVELSSTLTVTNNLNIDALATVTFENNASLVQTSTTATNNNTGKIYYKRHTTPVRRYDYTYWSSPVQPQTMIALSPNTLPDKYWSFDSDANDWVLSDGGVATMQPANGYSIRAPQTFDIVTTAIDTAPTFFGVPNNGNYTFSSTVTGVEYKSYLLGNPYPSALDADAFLEANKTVLDGTLYFWTHNSNVTPSGAFYEYSDNDYATYNLTGGTGVDGPYPKGGVKAPNTGVNNSIPLGKIAAGQGFFATGIATGTVNFTNAMRVGVGLITGDNSQFFRTSKTKSKTTTAIEKNRVWLNLYNDQGAFKQALIGYVTGATNEYDSGYDGESFDGNKYVDFYSVTPENYLVIQGRALPFDESDTVPLGYRSSKVMNLNISIDQTDGLLATQSVFIEDKLLNVIHNIKDTPYAFTTLVGTFDDRFVLRYTDKTLGTGDFNPLSNQIIISKDKNELKIKSELETIKRVTVFDLLGRKVFEKDTEDSNEFRSSSVSLSKQIGVVKVTLTNGKVISKKVRF